MFTSLQKLDDSSRYLKSESFGKAKRELEESSELVLRRMKAVKLADRSEYGWATVSEYLSDAELASNSEEEKRIYRSERRAERKIKERQRQKKEKRAKFRKACTSICSTYSGRYGESTSSRRLGPCFKISTISFILRLFHCYVPTLLCTSFVCLQYMVSH